MVSELKKQLAFVLGQRWQHVKRVTKFGKLPQHRAQVVWFMLRYVCYLLLTTVLLVVSLLLFPWLETLPFLLLPLALFCFFGIRILHKLKAHEYRSRGWKFYLWQGYYALRYVFYAVLFVLASTFVFGNSRGEVVLLIFVATIVLLKVLWRLRGEQFAFGTVPMVVLGITFMASPVFAPLHVFVFGGLAAYYLCLGIGKFKKRYTYKGRMLSVQGQILEELRKRSVS